MIDDKTLFVHLLVISVFVSIQYLFQLTARISINNYLLFRNIPPKCSTHVGHLQGQFVRKK
jgi:hypothetical protein